MRKRLKGDGQYDGSKIALLDDLHVKLVALSKTPLVLGLGHAVARINRADGAPSGRRTDRAHKKKKVDPDFVE